MIKGTFYGIGVGPGDPQLITVKAINVLKNVQAVFVPQTSMEKESTASFIAAEHINQGTSLLPLVFPMTRDVEILTRYWDEAVLQVKNYVDQGKNAAFLTLGDPMLYSTYVYIFKRIKKEGYNVETIPGIPSFCAAAAAAGVPLAEGEEKMALIPWAGEKNGLEKLLSDFDSVVLMKVSSDFEGVLDSLKKAGLLEKSMLVSKCGHDDEQICRLPLVSGEQEISYFSLVLARKKGDG